MQFEAGGRVLERVLVRWLRPIGWRFFEEHCGESSNFNGYSQSMWAF